MSFDSVTAVYLQSMLGGVIDPEEMQKAVDYIYQSLAQFNFTGEDITPWDITEWAKTDSFAQEIGLNTGDTHDVRVKIDNQNFNHKLDLSYFLGLGLYKAVAGGDFKIFVYDVEIPHEYFTTPAPRFVASDTSDYIELNDGNRFAFPDAQQAFAGFNTGATWDRKSINELVKLVRISGVLYDFDKKQPEDDVNVDIEEDFEGTEQTEDEE